MASTAAAKLFREGVRICRHRGSLATAEAKLMKAIALDPSLTAQAYLELSAGADARLYDRSEVVGYRRKALEHLKRLESEAGQKPEALWELARAFQHPPTLAGFRRSLKYLDRLVRLDDRAAVHAERAQVLEEIHWLTFGGMTLGYPSASVRFAQQKKKLKQLKAMWREIAEAYEMAGPKLRTKAASWRRHLTKLEAAR